MIVILKNQESYYSIDDKKEPEKNCKVEEESLEGELSEVVQQVNSSEVADGLLTEDGQEDGGEGELVGDDIQLEQQGDAEEDDSQNTHHVVFPIIEVSSGKKQ